MKIYQKAFSFSSPIDQIPLEGTYIYPDAPVGIVQFVHGMAEHQERYFGVMRALAQAGYACAIHNHRGHGNCALLGHFGKGGAEGAVADAMEVSKLAKKEFPDLPLYLFGHSMGSLIVRCYMKKDDTDLAGVFVCGTPFATKAIIKAGRAFVALKLKINGDAWRSNTVNAMVTGAFNKGIEKPCSPNQWISYNPENVAAYDADERCGFCFTLNGFEALLKLMDETFSSKGWAVKNPTLPVHFLSGEDDPCHTGIQNFDAAAAMIAAKGYPTTKKLFPQMRHEILLEKESAMVVDHILNVLKEMAL